VPPSASDGSGWRLGPRAQGGEEEEEEEEDEAEVEEEGKWGKKKKKMKHKKKEERGNRKKTGKVPRRGPMHWTGLRTGSSLPKCSGAGVWRCPPMWHDPTHGQTDV